MKVTVQQFQLALGMFEEEMLRCIESKWQRALAAVKILAYGSGISKIVEQTAKDGMVDVDEVKKYVEGVMKPCDGEIPVPLDFEVMGQKLAEPLDMVIKQADVDKFFSVTLPSVTFQNRS